MIDEQISREEERQKQAAQDRAQRDLQRRREQKQREQRQQLAQMTLEAEAEVSAVEALFDGKRVKNEGESAIQGAHDALEALMPKATDKIMRESKTVREAMQAMQQAVRYEHKAPERRARAMRWVAEVQAGYAIPLLEAKHMLKRSGELDNMDLSLFQRGPSLRRDASPRSCSIRRRVSPRLVGNG